MAATTNVQDMSDVLAPTRSRRSSSVGPRTESVVPVNNNNFNKSKQRTGLTRRVIIGRIKLEEKSKVVAADWGKNLFSSLTRQLFYNRRCEEQDELHQDDLKEKDKGIEKFCSQTAALTFYSASVSVFLLLLEYAARIATACVRNHSGLVGFQSPLKSS